MNDRDIGDELHNLVVWANQLLEEARLITKEIVPNGGGTIHHGLQQQAIAFERRRKVYMRAAKLVLKLHIERSTHAEEGEQAQAQDQESVEEPEGGSGRSPQEGSEVPR